MDHLFKTSELHDTNLYLKETIMGSCAKKGRIHQPQGAHACFNLKF